MPTKTKKTTSVEKGTIPIIVEEEQIMPDADETITFKRSHFYSVLVVLAFAVGILVGYVVWGRGGTTAAAEVPAQAAAAQQPSGQVAEAPTAQPQFVRYDITNDGYPSLGPVYDPTTIVKFIDTQFQFSSAFHH